LIKIRNKRIALLLVLAMLATMFIGVGAASAVTSDNGNMTISKSINKNVNEDALNNLGYVKVAIDAEDAIVGQVRWQVTLPSDVDFGSSGGTDTANGFFNTTASTAYSVVLPLAQAYIDSAAEDDINVDVTITYLDNNNNEYDKFEGTLLLAQKGDEVTTVTAASPKAVSMGDNKKLAKITFSENLAGSMQAGSKVALELPDGFKWSQTTGPDFTQGIYGLTCDTTATYNTDKTIMYLTVATASVGSGDKVKVVPYVTVFPDAPDGDVVVNVFEEVSDTNVSSTDLTLATVGAAEVTITAKDTSSSADDYVYRGQSGKQLYKITLETDGTFTSGDDLLVTLPDGVQFVENTAVTATGLDFKGLYDDNQSAWFQVIGSSTSDRVISLIKIAATPDAKAGD